MGDAALHPTADGLEFPPGHCGHARLVCGGLARLGRRPIRESLIAGYPAVFACLVVTVSGDVSQTPAYADDEDEDPECFHARDHA
jgi:hypothetical protein